VDIKNNPTRPKSLERLCNLFLKVYYYAKADDHENILMPIQGHEGKGSKKYKVPLKWSEKDFEDACIELLRIFRIQNRCTCVGKNISHEQFLASKNSHLPTDNCFIRDFYRNSAGRKKYMHLVTVHFPILMKKWKEFNLQKHDHESLERNVQKSKRRIQNNMSLNGIRQNPEKVGEFVLTDSAFGDRLEYLVFISDQVVKSNKKVKYPRKYNFILPKEFEEEDSSDDRAYADE
jgi:hypothetical protein